MGMCKTNLAGVLLNRNKFNSKSWRRVLMVRVDLQGQLVGVFSTLLKECRVAMFDFLIGWWAFIIYYPSPPSPFPPPTYLHLAMPPLIGCSGDGGWGLRCYTCLLYDWCTLKCNTFFFTLIMHWRCQLFVQLKGFTSLLSTGHQHFYSERGRVGGGGGEQLRAPSVRMRMV